MDILNILNNLIIIFNIVFIVGMLIWVIYESINLKNDYYYNLVIKNADDETKLLEILNRANYDSMLQQKYLNIDNILFNSAITTLIYRTKNIPDTCIQSTNDKCITANICKGKYGFINSAGDIGKYYMPNDRLIECYKTNRKNIDNVV